MKVSKKVQLKRHSSTSTSNDKITLKRCTVNLKRCDKLISKLIGRNNKTMVVKKYIKQIPTNTGYQTKNNVVAKAIPKAKSMILHRVVSKKPNVPVSTPNRVTPRSSIVKSDKDLLKYTTPLVATNERTRRTPKPNPKYINESMDTKWKGIGSEDHSSSGETSDNDDVDDDYDAHEDDENEPFVSKESKLKTIDSAKRIGRNSDGPSQSELKAVANKMAKPTLAVIKKSSILTKRKISFDDDIKKQLTKKEKVKRVFSIPF